MILNWFTQVDSVNQQRCEIVVDEIVVVEKYEFEVCAFDLCAVNSFRQPVMIGKFFHTVHTDVECDCVFNENLPEIKTLQIYFITFKIS